MIKSHNLVVRHTILLPDSPHALTTHLLFHTPAASAPAPEPQLLQLAASLL